MAKKQKFYVVWKGRQTGIFTTWSECEKQVKKFQGGLFKAYETEEEAKKAFKVGPTYKQNDIGRMEKASKIDKRENKKQEQGLVEDEVSLVVHKNSISVDAACSGSPGIMEYRAVWTDTGKVIFNSKKFPLGTSNIGEFLALVGALKYLEERNQSLIVYSDSITAMAWYRKKKANSDLVRNEQTEELWKLIEEAEHYLRTTTFKTTVLRWYSKQLGEIKADFGNKSKSRKKSNI